MLIKSESCVATAGVGDWAESNGIMREIMKCLDRHFSGDWGEVCEEDAAANDLAAKTGDRLLLSAYTVEGRKIWIITEWDRSVTTVLFPEEY